MLPSEPARQATHHKLYACLHTAEVKISLGTPSTLFLGVNKSDPSGYNMKYPDNINSEELNFFKSGLEGRFWDLRISNFLARSAG